ncbi:MAG: DUF3293 domain-containing protein [Nitrosomonas sp.]|nr:DUF3293 domain-containing protein [Nitrosomonas sp.]MCP5250862.1 DUF3293 domain-containing protein [Burkholderiales bacterium]MCP5291381.1 DUF3293 domain-containing protein [Burkholderiales bacterium]MDR4519571.1 DUF3293 domain-containing protein [Nitrosomonas sp.]HQU62216.1 DUF3293 domain-containing protein [Nitrosomonas sp.]
MNKFPDSAIDSVIDAVTIKAYLETEYRIYSATPFTLKVGMACPILAELHKTHAVTESAFITACNPFSTILSETDNVARHTELEQLLTQRGFVFFQGIGKHPTDNWPGEPGFLVFGIGLEAARVLARQLEQNAIIWNTADAIPQLILLR